MIEYLPLQQITAQHLNEIQDAIARVVEGGWYLRGEATALFEEHYARYIGTRHCIGCGNGLDALKLIFRAYKELGLLHDGDEVLVPANTFIASILSITETGLRARLVEPRLDTLEIDEDRLEAALSPQTRALLLVHLYGRCAYTERIGAFCRRHNLLLIEDNAQAHGCRYTPDNQQASTRLTGSLGHAAAHSFYPGKNLGALGDAGAVTTNDEQLATTIRALANYGSSRKYVFPYRGQNSRMDELQAAVLDVKLKYLDHDNDRRRAIGRYYEAHIQSEKVAVVPSAHIDNVYHIFPLLCQERDQLQQQLLEAGIQTMVHYPIPPHQQACYREWNSRSLPITEQIHRMELSLPCNQTMTDAEVASVVETINHLS